VHELDECCCGRHVSPRNGPGCPRRRARLIEGKVHAIAVRLAYHHHRHTPRLSLVEKRLQGSSKLRIEWKVARPIGLQHQSANPRQERERQFRIQSWIYFEQENPGIQLFLESGSAARGKAPGEGGIHSESAQGVEIGAFKRVILCNLDFVGAVSPVEVRVEAEGDFRRASQRRRHGIHEVEPRVGADLPQGPLRSGQHHGLAQAGEGEGEGTGGKSQGVGAMGHHRAVDLWQAAVEVGGHAAPQLGLHLTGIKVGEEFQFDVSQLEEFWGSGLEDLEEGGGAEHRRSSTGHSEGAAGMQQEDSGHRGFPLWQDRASFTSPQALARNPNALYPSKWKLLLLLLSAASLMAVSCHKENDAAPAQGPLPPAPPVAMALPEAPPPEATLAQAAPAAAGPAAGPGGGDAVKAALSVPGLDFSSLSAPAQKELANVFSDSFCYCGCPHTLGACLKSHGGCKHARRMAVLAATEASAGAQGLEISNELERYYQSFRERKPLKLDERTCRGSKTAKVTLMEFSDFECPYCRAAAPMLEKFAKDMGERVRFCYVPFPLPMHPNAILAGQAALYARDHGKFWEMHDLLFENQTQLSAVFIKTLAGRLGLDTAGLQKVFDEKRYVDELTAFKDSGRTGGVDSTPSVFFNGRKFNLPLNPETLAHSVEDELEWMANKNAWAAD